MEPHEEQTERYLKEFRPGAIHRLEVIPAPRNVLWKGLAAAAVVAVCGAGLSWFAHSQIKPTKEAAGVRALEVSVASQRQHRSSFALTSLALQDEKQFDALLTEESRRSLPRIQEEHSALKVLAKD